MFSAISGSGNTTTLVLLVTELMGLYAISSLLLIRKQLPIKYRCTPQLAQGKAVGLHTVQLPPPVQGCKPVSAINMLITGLAPHILTNVF